MARDLAPRLLRDMDDVSQRSIADDWERIG
jgi:hypothetical protein